ncbi:MAG TPA: helix-hairpin-helix domain-containing protein, partial [Bacteroidales bacterium]|nr:helix-hairpin-helix domain-containing protein [Bacteroidales bacterium]
MSDFLEPIKNWFGYDRRERRVSFLLLILILIVIGIRMSYPHNKTEVIDLTSDFTFDNEKVSENKMISRISELSDTSVKAVRIGAGRNHFNSKNSEIIELNSCDSAILEGLPGIGPVLSARIIRFRNLLGGFSSVNQLKEVYGLSPETFESIKGRFSADQSKTRKTNINSA